MTRDYYNEAIAVAETLVSVMTQDLHLQAPTQYFLDPAGERVWLIAILDPKALGGQISAYTRPQTLHQLSTALGGRPVILSNHTGLRYGILMSEKPKLPLSVLYPEDVPTGVVPLGRTLNGVLHPQASRLMNVLVGGEQGSGKSTLLHLFAYAAFQNGWQTYAADPRSMTFDDTWNGVLRAPVADKAEGVFDILDVIDREMERRAALFRSVRENRLPAGSVDAYNAMVESADRLPRIFFLVDEANTFLANDKLRKRVEDLSRQPRKFGIHFILAGHNWRDADVPRGLSANFHTRISLRVADDTSGRVVLNNPRWGKAMMKVTQPGRAVVFLDGRFARTQFYKLDEGRIIPMLLTGSGPAAALSDKERQLGERALRETDGKVSREVLTGWGIGRSEADRIMERWTTRGWAEKDPQRANATYLTSILRDLLRNPAAPATPRNRPATPAAGYAAPATGTLSPEAA
jgi:hypothetical protein